MQYWPLVHGNAHTLRNLISGGTDGVNSGAAVSVNTKSQSPGIYNSINGQDRIFIGSTGWGPVTGGSNGLSFTFVAKCISATAGVRKVLLGDWDSGGSGSRAVLEAQSDNTWKAWVYSDAGSPTNAVGGTFTTNHVHSVGLSWNAVSEVVSLHIDGIEVATGDSDGQMGAGQDAAMGAGAYTDGAISWDDGFIWDFRIYRGVLSDAQHMDYHLRPHDIFAPLALYIPVDAVEAAGGGPSPIFPPLLGKIIRSAPRHV